YVRVATLFPYTTLFRSSTGQGSSSCIPAALNEDTAGLNRRDAARSRDGGLLPSPLPDDLRAVKEIHFTCAKFGSNFRLIECGRRSEEHTSELQSRVDLV